ncbi:MAG: PTS chitobiose transporter subunit IIC, partial [Fusobacteriaceae bacterium]
MSKFMNMVEEKLMPIAGKVGQNRYLNAIKDGFVYTMPFLIIGSFILLVVNLPFTDVNNVLYMEWYDKLMKAYKMDLVQPFYVSMG